MKRTASILVIAWLVAVCSSCSRKVDDNIGYGTLENGVYRNEYFGMTADLPDGWHALDDDARKAVMQRGEKLLAGQDKNLQAVLDVTELRTVTLLIAYEYPPGTPVPYNPSMACVAEKVCDLPGIKKGSDYLFHAKQLMERSQLHYDFVGDTHSKEIGGVSFDVQDTELMIKGLRVQQKYCAAIMKGYAISFVLSLTTKEEEQAIEQLLKGVHFRKQ